MTDMGPGAALDVLVAEKVLGRVVCRDVECDGESCPAETSGIYLTIDTQDKAIWIGLDDYSTDLTTCERAAEEWRGRSDRPRWYRLCSGSRDGTLPAAALFEGSVCIVEWSGETLAHALSLALLKACGS